MTGPNAPFESRLAAASRSAAAMAKTQEGATPGPWEADVGASAGEDYDLWFARGPMKKVVGFQAGKAAAMRDADFLAAARAYPAASHAALLAEAAAEVTALRARLLEMVETYEEECTRWPTSDGHPLYAARAALGLDDPAAGREGE